MGSTYYSLHVHVVFATKDRRALIAPDWMTRLHEYLGGCARTADAVAEEVGGIEDHVHMLMGIRTTHRISDLMREIKSASSLWFHEEIGERFFGWQDGYGAFSVSRSNVDSVRRYIRNQREHHRTRSFDDELRAFLAAHGIVPGPAVRRP
ncbi:MAG TPA: IS200/IS605 family transposase [Thermoanaerobaculia bacterium]|nr:IS200/IS605 family transposase [Thermoanaerobaculia bacterium]